MGGRGCQDMCHYPAPHGARQLPESGIEVCTDPRTRGGGVSLGSVGLEGARKWGNAYRRHPGGNSGRQGAGQPSSILLQDLQ